MSYGTEEFSPRVDKPSVRVRLPWVTALFIRAGLRPGQKVALA